MKDKQGNIIYIGKAKALKNRVTQYFGSGNRHTEKVRRMVASTEDFEYILCDSEFEALILENSLIKQNQPKYNILLKDDKGYHYIKVTRDRWKRITTCMQIENDGAEYIGPYYSGYVVKDTVDEVQKIFKLPDCSRSFDKPSKPCLNFHIGRCDAPCRGSMDLSEYLEAVGSAVSFIKHGGDDMIKRLSARMESAAQALDFEYAAKLRDRINAINKLSERQKVVMCTHPSQDVFACALTGETACVSVFVFRNSRLTDKKHFIIEGVSDRAEMYAQVLQQYYMNTGDIPPRILVDALPAGHELIERWLREKSGRKSVLVLPKAGEPKRLLDMCRNNAADNLSQKTGRTGKETAALNELAVLLGLQKVPRIIEAYDISNTAGDENVAGMVVFHDGRPYKPHYKRFKIKSFSGQDDYRSMAEVLHRRLCEYEKGSGGGFDVLPDLILLDGGRGQVSAVAPVLAEHNTDIPLFGMVKDSKHRTRAITAGGDDITVKAVRSAYTLVTQIQDEVHRFAVSYHKSRRSKKMLSSSLTEIEGIGESRAAALLRHFKTIKAIRGASVEELAAVKGISRDVARKIHSHFNT